VDGCPACDLAEGRLDLPGGRIHATSHWLIEHCVGPLGVGTLIVKPRRHVVHLWELDRAEAEELGPLLQRVVRVVAALTHPDQVYVALWSHRGAVPRHIHFVVQPVSQAVMAEHGGLYGLSLQREMLERGKPLDRGEVERFAEAARAELAT
jgi:diadenosine tetraphosphate (Ap4A) HIT family hydrolase